MCCDLQTHPVDEAQHNPSCEDTEQGMFNTGNSLRVLFLCCPNYTGAVDHFCSRASHHDSKRNLESRLESRAMCQFADMPSKPLRMLYNLDCLVVA